jgi:hypothetical protein
LPPGIDQLECLLSLIIANQGDRVIIYELIGVAIDFAALYPKKCLRRSEADDHRVTVGEGTLDLVKPSDVNKEPICDAKVGRSRTDYIRRSRTKVLGIRDLFQ